MVDGENVSPQRDVEMKGNIMKDLSSAKHSGSCFSGDGDQKEVVKMRKFIPVVLMCLIWLTLPRR